MTVPLCTTSQRQSPAPSSPRSLELWVRQGDPPTISFTRATSASPLNHTCSISLPAAFEILLKQNSFPALSGKVSAAPTSSLFSTAVPTLSSAAGATAGVPAWLGCWAPSDVVTTNKATTAGQYLRISHLEERTSYNGSCARRRNCRVVMFVTRCSRRLALL